jgi:hypothetical protein
MRASGTAWEGALEGVLGWDSEPGSMGCSLVTVWGALGSVDDVSPGTGPMFVNQMSAGTQKLRRAVLP